MERGLYIAASGMLAEMVRQDQIANDLANASTPGYKADRATQKSFGDILLANTVSGQTVGPLGLGAQIDKIVTDVKAVVDDATEKCKAAPNPSLDILTTDVYADGGFAWRN